MCSNKLFDREEITYCKSDHLIINIEWAIRLERIVNANFQGKVEKETLDIMFDIMFDL